MGCVALEPVITQQRCESKWRACPGIQRDRLVIIFSYSQTTMYAQIKLNFIKKGKKMLSQLPLPLPPSPYPIFVHFLPSDNDGDADVVYV